MLYVLARMHWGTRAHTLPGYGESRYKGGCSYDAATLSRSFSRIFDCAALLFTAQKKLLAFVVRLSLFSPVTKNALRATFLQLPS